MNSKSVNLIFCLTPYGSGSASSNHNSASLCHSQGPQEEALRERDRKGGPEEEDQNRRWHGHREQEEQEELVSFQQNLLYTCLLLML